MRDGAHVRRRIAALGMPEQRLFGAVRSTFGQVSLPHAIGAPP
jgi:hypothetical protein